MKQRFRTQRERERERERADEGVKQCTFALSKGPHQVSDTIEHLIPKPQAVNDISDFGKARNSAALEHELGIQQAIFEG